MILDQQKYQEGRTPIVKRPKDVINLNPEMDEAFARRVRYVPEFSQLQEWVRFDNGAQQRAYQLRQQIRAERRAAAIQSQRVQQQQKLYSQMSRRDDVQQPIGRRREQRLRESSSESYSYSSYYSYSDYDSDTYDGASQTQLTHANRQYYEPQEDWRPASVGPDTAESMQLINSFSQYWREGESGLQALSRGEDTSICYVDPFSSFENKRSTRVQQNPKIRNSALSRRKE